MAATPKPHRIAVLVPEVKIDGPDAAYEREASVLLWTACIEILQRHPRLAVLDADATPLFPQDGHFAPEHAGRGGKPTDAFYAPTRRDEVIWLELGLGAKAAVVRLHVVGRDGKQESFDALGRSTGEQIAQVITAWCTARGLGAPTKKIEAVTADEILAIVRIVGPTLVEQARAWSLPVAQQPVWRLAIVEDEAEEDEAGDTHTLSADAILREAEESPRVESTIDSTMDGPLPDVERRRSIARPLVNRLPQAFRGPTLRLLELALREDLIEDLLAVDSDHPQALFARFEKTSPPDFGMLRQVITSAPGWARPYEVLAPEEVVDEDDPIGKLTAPSELEAVAAAGMAALCRPAALDALSAAAERLVESHRVDEGKRLVERGIALHPEDPRAHLSLLYVHEHTDRDGAWLDQAQRSSSLHGCPMDPGLPWYPDQIQVDLRASNALLEVGRLDEAIALRTNRLEGREAAWPNHARVLASWRKDPRFVAWSYAREGYFRGDEARAVEGFGRIEPGDSVDLKIFLDSLVALGREEEVALAWSQFGLGRGSTGAVARIAAARALIAAGEHRLGIEEMWRVQLTAPGRDAHTEIARCGLAMAGTPIDVIDAALAERIAVGAPTLARRMARIVADFVPAAAKSGLVQRALGKSTPIDFDPAWLNGFGPETRAKPQLDKLFGAVGKLRKGPPQGFDIADELVRGDALVARWLEVVFTEASEDDHAALAQAAAYAAASALARYLAATTYAPTTLTGALRTVAGEALALVHRYRHALADREARAVLGAIEPLLRRIDRWLGAMWLGSLERALGIDERSAGDVAGFVREFPTLSARILGPEETTVLSWSIARMHRDREPGWAGKVGAQASRLASHTGSAGVDEWADAIVAQLAAREIELDDAIDGLHTACYLGDGITAVPCLHLARVLFDAGRAPAALAVVSSGLRAAVRRGETWRDEQVATVRERWRNAGLDVPFDFAETAAAMFEALQKADPARAEKLGRWAVAFDPLDGEAHRNLGLALAQQGKVFEAMHHLVLGTREQATQILSGVLYQSGHLAEAMAVLDFASRWYNRAEQWLTYGGIAYAAMDNPRTVRAYKLAYQLDREAFDASQLNAYAGVLDEVGDYATCELIANHLLHAAGDDLMWQTNAWNHLACSLIGQGKFAEAVELAERAVAQNPLAENAPNFVATLARAQAAQPPPPVTVPTQTKVRDPIYAALEAGDHTIAATKLSDPSWRVRRAALRATRFRFASENQIAVTPRARAAAIAVLADTAGTMDREALLARCLALQIREEAYFPRDPLPLLGDRMTRDAFYQEFRARGGVVLGPSGPGADAPPPAAFVDRTVMPGGKVSRTSDYVALLRDLAALAPKEALAQFDLDDAGYMEVARAWAQAMVADPTLARTIAAGLAKR
ncbi:MAG: tetratricopeptide repeat protein [Kofleriaceae bacterium]